MNRRRIRIRRRCEEQSPEETGRSATTTATALAGSGPVLRAGGVGGFAGSACAIELRIGLLIWPRAGIAGAFAVRSNLAAGARAINGVRALLRNAEFASRALAVHKVRALVGIRDRSIVGAGITATIGRARLGDEGLGQETEAEEENSNQVFGFHRRKS